MKMVKLVNLVDPAKKSLHILGAQKFEENNVKSRFYSKKCPQFSADQLQGFLGVSSTRRNDKMRALYEYDGKITLLYKK